MMVDEFQELGSSFRQFLAVISYHLPRVSSFMVFFPLFNQSFGGTFLKMSVGTVLVLYPAFAALLQFQPGTAQASMTLVTFCSEVMLGGMLGLAMALPYFAFRAFGAMIDVYRGATFSAQVTGNDSGEQLPLETLFGLIYCALVLAGPGLHGISSHLLNSYLLMPPGTINEPFIGSWAPVLMRMVSDQILFGVLLSAPVLLAVLVVEVAFEIVSAFTQQLQVYNLEYGLRSVMGIGMALLLLHVAQDEIISQFSAYSRALTRLLENAL